MNKIIYIWKPIGLTPLETIILFKSQNTDYIDEKISYAGRLDPMAEGILVLLIGDENKNREEYLNLEKTYESEIVFGISTDSFDGLGKITNIDFKNILKKEIEDSLKKSIGEKLQEYPPFSSKAVNGKPLFWWARNNKLNQIKIPKRKINIYSIDLLDHEKISSEKLANKIAQNIKKVKGDFRQDEILKEWRMFKINYKDKELIKIKIRVYCSSGTYIRSMANDLGNALGVPAFAYSIERIAVGNIKKEDCLRLKLS